MDDIVVDARNSEKHDELVREVMRRLEEKRMRVNGKKMELKMGEVKLLGVRLMGRNRSRVR
jgi:hypothetical protein